MCRPSTRPQQQQQRKRSRAAPLHLMVQHNYRDRANEVPPPHAATNDPQKLIRTMCIKSPKASASSSTSSAQALSFPMKLYEMLDRVQEDGYDHIVSWQPHGRCFIIHQQAQFIEILLPRYFSLNKIASFQRQLNLYGFGRITQGLDKGGYYHECFLRGKAFLAYKIQRIKVKGTGVRGKANPDQEPDFWAMSWVGATKKSNEDTESSSSSSCANEKTDDSSNSSPMEDDAAKNVVDLVPAETASISRNSLSFSDVASVVSHDEEKIESLMAAEAEYLSEPESLLSDDENVVNENNNSSADNSMILTQWGMPFQALFELAVDDGNNAAVATSAADAMESPSFHDLDDQTYLDNMLSGMMKHTPAPVTPPPSYNNNDVEDQYLTDVVMQSLLA